MAAKISENVTKFGSLNQGNPLSAILEVSNSNPVIRYTINEAINITANAISVTPHLCFEVLYSSFLLNNQPIKNPNAIGRTINNRKTANPCCICARFSIPKLSKKVLNAPLLGSKIHDQICAITTND